MKVTSGKFGGRKLIENTFDHIRPTADMVKQAIFNKLEWQVKDAKVLDLFCGTGALGIEAISRGGREVVFVDKDKRSVMLTQNNLKNLNINARVICADFEQALKQLKDGEFDIILLDPPYKAGLYEKALSLILALNVLSDNGIVVCEHERKTQIDFTGFEIVDEKTYGIKEVTYLKKQY